MEVWMLLLGVALLVGVFLDAAVTTVSAVSAGGPLTSRIGRLVWLSLRGLARTHRSRALIVAGPVVVFTMLTVWLVGLWAGWTLVVSSDPSAVVHAATGEAAGGWDRAYFAGFSVYTLGVGDFVPVGAPWQLVTVVASLSGFVLLTMTVSYLIPVTGAVTSRRARGMVLYGLGQDAEAILVNGYEGGSFAPLEQQLRQLTAELAQLTQSYVSYPVVHHFHSPHRPVAAEPGIAALHEATLVLEHGLTGEVSFDPAVLRQLRDVFDRFCEITAQAVPVDSSDAPPGPDLDRLRAAGLPVATDGRLGEGQDQHRWQRRTMHALLSDARWPWEGMVIAEREDLPAA